MRRMPYWRFLCACLAHACNGTTPSSVRWIDGTPEDDAISLDANPRIWSGVAR